MTRDDAIFYIKQLQKTYASMDKKVAEAVDMAISALSAESDTLTHEEAWAEIEQVTSKLENPCGSLLEADSADAKEQKSKLDLISRAEAIEAVESNSYGMGSRASIKAIKALPSADRPSGEWQPKPDGSTVCACSVCGSEEVVPTCMGEPTIWNYCPSCGAKMKGGNE